MLILPNQPKVLLPIPDWQWREPSLSQPRDQFGRQNRTRFKLELWRRDGALVDQRWFDDRVEFDYELWRVLREPYADIVPLWATVATLTVAGANLTYSVPADWNSANNLVECIAGGAGGTARRVPAGGASGFGGGGGGYDPLVNVSLTPGGSATYTVPIGGAGGALASGATSAIDVGDDGGSAWFNGTTYANASGGATGGVGSSGVGGGGKNAGAKTGGNSATPSGSGDISAAGGGGAAGPHGNGQNSPSPSGGPASAGGAGDNGSGGAGGSQGSLTLPGGNGSAGSNMGGGIGAGGGGGGGFATGGDAGNYGGGGGAGCRASSGAATGGKGAQGAIIVTYTPALSTGFLMMF